MKNQFKSFVFILSFLSAATLLATTHTVDNKTGSAAQFTDLQVAIDAAQAGDTILVAGSTTTYGNVTIRKQLVFLGVGYTGAASAVSTFTFQNLTASSGSSGSYLSGFNISTLRFDTQYPGQTTRGTLSDIIVERNQVASFQFLNSLDAYSNFNIKNNVFTGPINFNTNNSNDATYSNIQFVNNILSTGAYFISNINTSVSNGVETITSGQGVGGVFIRQNIFLGVSSSSCFHDIRGAVVENNIFYGRPLINSTSYQNLDTLDYNLTFNNNITYLSNQDLTQNQWFAVGANNTNVDPEFVSFPVDGGGFSLEHDYNLQSTSPGIAAGVNSEDLGIYGGSFPWPGPLDLKPKGPIMTELKPVGSPSVPAGGTLEVQFKSVINN